MFTILLIFHVIIAVTLIIFILMQKNSQDGLQGIGGGSNSQSLISSASSANFMTKTTTILAIFFMVNSLVLANLSNTNSDQSKIDQLEEKSKMKEENVLPIAK